MEHNPETGWFACRKFRESVLRDPATLRVNSVCDPFLSHDAGFLPTAIRKLYQIRIEVLADCKEGCHSEERHGIADELFVW